MTYGGSAYGGNAVGSTGSAIQFESGSLSAAAEVSSVETGSAAESGNGASLSFAIGAERKVLIENGALTAVAAMAANEQTTGLSQGTASLSASGNATSTGRVDQSADVSVLPTVAVSATGRKGESGAVSVTNSISATEAKIRQEVGQASAATLASVTERKVQEEQASAFANAAAITQEGIGFRESATATVTLTGAAEARLGFAESATATPTASMQTASFGQTAEQGNAAASGTANALENITKAPVDVADVEKYAALGWQQLEPEVKNTMLNTAKALIENQFTDRTSTLPTLVGDKDDATELLAAHLFDLAEGGEAQSEGGEAGNVTYNTTAGETLNSLTETRFGRLFADVYLRDRMGIGVVRSR